MQTSLFDRRELHCDIRSATRADLGQLVAIDRDSYRHGWTVRKFASAGKRVGNMLFVAEVAETVIGYLLVSISHYTVRVLRMAIAPTYRRCGLGSDMLDFRTLDQSRRVLIDVREDTLETHLFLRAAGFRAVNTFDGFDVVERVRLIRFVRDARGPGGGREPARGRQ